ncbi:MAG: hypothetical protein LBI13_07605 [Streptococcaceae bacterium]|jgi:hypothetical protein|nr:hypothetical protein [Streptococcaceae bacterium]
MQIRYKINDTNTSILEFNKVKYTYRSKITNKEEEDEKETPITRFGRNRNGFDHSSAIICPHYGLGLAKTNNVISDVSFGKCFRAFSYKKRGFG